MSEIVIAGDSGPVPGYELVVNFGVVTGRQATRTELRRLGQHLVDVFPAASVVFEVRFEHAPGSEAEVHQVRVELRGDEPRTAGRGLAARRIVEEWARSCIAFATGADLSDAELAARDAVVGDGAVPPRVPQP